MVKYRRSSVEDKTYIRRLDFLTEVFGDESVDPDPADMAEGQAFYVDAWQPEDGVIAFDDVNVPAGGVWLLWGTEERHGLGYVGEGVPELAIAVETRAAGQGIGRELLAHACGLAIERGAQRISLCVHHDNDRARRMYERAGFEFVHDVGAYAVMVRDLAPETT